MELPLAEATEGPLFDREEPHDVNDAAFADWEAPLVWHHQKSYLWVDTFFKGRKSLHFAFEKRVPEEVWFKGWHLWYDNCVVHRRRFRDGVLTGTFAFEELTCAYTADNLEHVRPWTGIVARMRDVRCYYFCCLEFPNKVVLYRREDKQWTVLAEHQVDLRIFTAYTLKLEMDGQMFRVWLDDEPMFTVADYTLAEGWCGLRSTCTSFVTDFEIDADPVPPRVDVAQEALAADECVAPADPVVLRDIDLAAHGSLSKTVRHNATVQPGHYAHADEPQLLVRLFDAPDGSSHVLLDTEGDVVWKAALPDVGRMLPTPPRDDGGRDFYAVSPDELMIVDGRTGEVTRRTETPRASDGSRPKAGNGPVITADLDGSGLRNHFFLTFGADAEDIFAVGPDLEVRWHVEAISGNGHGHHNSACDVDGDGREEIFAGCLLLDADGEVVWRQDEITRRLLVPNGGHVDSSVMGFHAGPDAAPTLHMASSSAGHLVCDARTGELLAAHPQGHVQFVSAGAVVPGSSDVHAVSTNRWGNYGATGIYAADGRRVARFQPGFVCQHAIPLNWTGSGTEHLLVCDGPGWRGIYDHTGRRLVDLDPLVPYDDAFGQRYDRLNVFRAALRPGDPRDVIVLRLGSTLRLLAPKDTLAKGTRAYAPERRTNESRPGWMTV